jgi:hypothetical protein
MFRRLCVGKDRLRARGAVCVFAQRPGAAGGRLVK